MSRTSQYGIIDAAAVYTLKEFMAVVGVDDRRTAVSLLNNLRVQYVRHHGRKGETVFISGRQFQLAIERFAEIEGDCDFEQFSEFLCRECKGTFSIAARDGKKRICCPLCGSKNVSLDEG